MPLFRSSTRGYSGTESYKYIDKLINGSSKTLKIISPFIGPHYARMLISQARKKKIYIITAPPTDSAFGSSQAKSIELLKERVWVIGAGPSATAALLGVVALALSQYFYAALLFLLAVAILCAAVYLYMKGRGRPMLKVAKGRFIHEKTYITDKTAITGSANLTSSGTHGNVEHIEIIDDKKRINELSRHFDSLWNT
jgi:phosphatidylserine/phosphatidylglycerophosphate/cardiolipin synthase-like enzyme